MPPSRSDYFAAFASIPIAAPPLCVAQTVAGLPENMRDPIGSCFRTGRLDIAQAQGDPRRNPKLKEIVAAGKPSAQVKLYLHTSPRADDKLEIPLCSVKICSGEKVLKAEIKDTGRYVTSSIILHC